jgi:UDP-N-acetylmuramoyl-tripeptide--D-alanyl-D-alanine ligase
METLCALARRVGGQLLGADRAFARVVSDSRQVRPGDLFVALAGARFDGHDFVRAAFERGAVGALVARALADAPAQVCVADTLAALQRYAASWRGDFDLPVIAVAGSNGKTTTKQLCAAVCAARGPVLATEGNLNNHIGVPLTLLRLRREHRTAVIELGANHAGEIAPLAAWTRPRVGVVTNAGEDHLAGFGSVEGSARTNGELFAALPPDGTAVINADDAYAPLWRELAAHAAVVSFGLETAADVSAQALALGAEGSRFRLVTPTGSAEVTLPLPGRHNVANALAAAAAGHALGLAAPAIAAHLSCVLPVPGRLNWKRAASGARVLDDTYNANPASLRAALALLATQRGERWLVLGDMQELGPAEIALHAQAGREARRHGVQRLYASGPLARAAAESFGAGARHFPDVEALIEALATDLAAAGADVAVLVKGSRAARLERVVAALTGSVAEVH